MSAKDRYANKALKSFRHLAKTLRTLKGDASEIKKALSENTRVLNFLDKEVGVQEGNASVKQTRAALSRLLFKYVTKEISLTEVVNKAESVFLNHYEKKRLLRAQRPLIDNIPKELREFLPPKIVVRVDEDGFIQEITDMFDNERHNLNSKIMAQREILKRKDEIMGKVYKDLKSKDKWVRTSALITSIIIETGIRPGNRNNGVVAGEKIIKTFGAVTLKGRHLKFLSDKVEIRFKGKKGTLNKATIQDPKIISALKRVATTGGDLFPGYDYDDLNKYFSANFSELNITDFRKLKATEEVFSCLLQERSNLYKRIKSYAGDEADLSKEKIISEIVRVFEEAHERAKIALSHESSTTTKKSYINPQVILEFLSRGGVLNSLEECILEGKTKLCFDPQVFISKASKTAGLGFYAERVAYKSLSEVMT